MDFLRGFSSDFIILQTDIIFDDYDLMENIFKYSCFSPIDIIIKSHYNLIDNKYTVYCDNKIDEDSMIHDIESNHLGEILHSNILAKLSFPKGIKKI